MATNPIAMMAMQALQARGGLGAGQGGAPPSMPGAGPQAGPPGGDPSGGGGGGLGDQYSQMVSELKGADPGMILRQVKALKQILAIMAVQNMERLPNISGKLMKIIPQFDGVMKEIQQAQNVNAAVRNPQQGGVTGGPIQMGAANPPQGLPSNPGPAM